MYDKQIHRDEFRLRVLLTNDCNLSCHYCLNDFQVKPGIPSYLNLYTAIEYIEGYCIYMSAKEQERIVTFSGGEPGLYNNLFELVCKAKQYDSIVKIE